MSLQLSVGIAFFLLPLLAGLWLLSSRLEYVPVSSWSEVEEMLRGRVAAIQHLVRFMVWFPLGGVIVALIAWSLRRAPLPWYVGGLSLLLWLTMMTAHYAPFSAPPQCKDGWITLTPHKDPNSPTGIYIPATLDEAINEFDRTVPACAVQKILEAGPDTFHLSLGMWMRNNWGLWHGSRLAQHLNAMGIDHPDDMSGIILTSYWSWLKNSPINIEEQVAWYQTYWRLVGGLFPGKRAE